MLPRTGSLGTKGGDSQGSIGVCLLADIPRILRFLAILKCLNTSTQALITLQGSLEFFYIWSCHYQSSFKKY